MLIIGAKGITKEVFDILIKNQDNLDNQVFYDDVNFLDSPFLFEKFPVLNLIEKDKAYFSKVDNSLVYGCPAKFIKQLTPII